MTDIDIFSEAKRVFELLPGAGTLEFAVEKLAAAGVEHARIGRWARGICAEYGIASYIQQPAWARMMRGAAQNSLAETGDNP